MYTVIESRFETEIQSSVKQGIIAQSYLTLHLMSHLNAKLQCTFLLGSQDLQEFEPLILDRVFTMLPVRVPIMLQDLKKSILK